LFAEPSCRLPHMSTPWGCQLFVRVCVPRCFHSIEYGQRRPRQPKKLARNICCLLGNLLLRLPPRCGNCLEHMWQKRWLVPARPGFAGLYAARHLHSQHKAQVRVGGTGVGPAKPGNLQGSQRLRGYVRLLSAVLTHQCCCPRTDICCQCAQGLTSRPRHARPASQAACSSATAMAQH
jgi:hypothetical protein